ncbi:restriction endonuclease subunit S [Neobacillus thermocopriae]|uniref:restriction endonuclease subunit S n=1 Tax=Neobacillus thermocopriae TaxID=1215031 RepID=UPI00376F6D6D
MSYSEWREVKFSDVVEMNPRLTLKKGTLAKKISMQDLKEFNRKIQSFELTKFTSGSKFQNGDTLLARITPCLENGKTAFVDILEDDEVAFGSTEFIVLRAKEGITDSKFVYYLSITPEFRNIAIKSMTGSSGRQRVQNSVLENTLITIPSLAEQKQISNVLSILDEKIEINNNINQTLEEIAQAIFKHWFVDFEFPNEIGEPYKSSGGKFVESELGMIPEGWKIINLGEIINISSGKRPKSKQDNSKEEYIYPLIGASSIMGYVNEFLYNEPILIIGRVGTHGIVQRYNEKCWPSDNTLVIKTEFYNFVYQILKLIDYTALNRGSTQPLITQTDIKNYQILLSDKNILDLYESITKSLFEKIDSNNQENKKLTKIRDYLLPKLMSGEIRIPEAEEAVESCLQKNN